MTTRLLSSLLLVCAMALASCYNDKADQLYPTTICNTTAVTYSGDVSKIMNQSCTMSSCHNVAAAGGYDLSGYAGVKTAVDAGRLIGAITHASGFSPMPKNAGKLSACSIDQITAWVNAGAPNN